MSSTRQQIASNKSHPWQRENANTENDDCDYDGFSYSSLSRRSLVESSELESSSSRSSSSSIDTPPGSPKAVDPEALECQSFHCCDISSLKRTDLENEKRRRTTDEGRDSVDENDILPPKKNQNIDKDEELSTAIPNPRSNRWWEPRGTQYDAPPRWWEAKPTTSTPPPTNSAAAPPPPPPPRCWERSTTLEQSNQPINTAANSSVVSSLSSSASSAVTPVPPPIPLRPSINLSLPGAFPIAGIGISNDGYNGEEEEKFEDEPSSSSAFFIHPTSARDRLLDSEEEILLEATLVSEKSSRRDFEQRSNSNNSSSNNELVFQAEPLQSKKLVTLKTVCVLIWLLLLIAVIGVTVGTELGRRKYEGDSSPGGSIEETPSPKNPIFIPIDDSLSTFPPDGSIVVPANSNNDTSSSTESPPIMATPPRQDTDNLPSSYPPTEFQPPATSSPSMSVSTVDPIDARNRFLDRLPDKTKSSVLDKPNSPQSFAYNWLIGHPRLSQHSINEQVQMFALATVYYGCGGVNWSHKDNWLNYDVDACDWESDTLDGLRCNRDANNNNRWYEILELNENMLTGTLPDEVWLLSTLVSIQLHGHSNLKGSIPTRIGKMLHLESLLLFDMALGGPIPKEIGHTKLKSLHVGGNDLSGTLPRELGNIQQLQHLFVNDNQLLGGPLPTHLGRLTDLEELALQNCSFVGTIPSHIGLATSLQLAYFAFNDFTGTIPLEFNRLSNLQALILQSNSLQGTIPALSNLKKAKYLLFGSNKLMGTIPPKVVSGWESLMMLDLGNNQITGTLPAEIGRLQQLQYVDVFNNSISGAIPLELGKLYNAEHIMLEQNHLTGTIPSTLGLLAKLERLWLHDNDLSGFVPNELCRLVESGTLQSLSVDCHKVYCECCDCSMSTPMAFVDEEGNAAVSRRDGSNQETNSNNLWDEIVQWASNLFG